MKKILSFILSLVILSGTIFAQQPGTSQYPTSTDTSLTLFEVANRANSTLSGVLSSGATSLTLTSASLFPNSGAISIDDEILYYTGKSTNTLTGLLRGRDGTSAASHALNATVSMRVTAKHHKVLADAIIATQTKLGTGSNTPTLGSFLTSRANGASTWGHTIGDTATANDNAWSAKGAVTSLLQGADTVSDTSSPATGGDPSVVFQTNRSGGAQGNGSTLFGFSFLASGKNNYTGLYSIGHYTANLTGVSGNVDIVASRNYVLMNPVSLGSATLSAYALWNQGESFDTGVNLVTTQNDTNNSTGADAPVGVGTSGRIISLAFGHQAGKHSTVDMMTEALNSNNSYAGWVVRANGLSQRILDYTDASMTLQGTWTATNGSATVSGSGGHGDVEAIAGDILSINGTNATVLSATANSITLTTVFAGSTGSSLTLSKKVQPIWLANNSYVWWNNAAGSARYRFAGLNASNVWSIDPDVRGVVAAGDFTVSGLLKAGTTPTTLTDSSGKVLSAALNTVGVPQGGSGAVTLTGLLQGNGTGAFTGISNSSTTGQILRVTGTSTYAWGALDLANSNAITGTLLVGNGGTNIASYAVGDLLYASGTTTLSKLADVAVGSVLVSGGVTTAPAYSSSPTISTSVTTPIVYGGSNNNSTLTLKGTSHASPSSAYIAMNTLVSGTLPGIIYVGASPSVSTINATGISEVMHLQGTDTGIVAMVLDSYGNNTVGNGSAFVFRNANGTSASPTASAANDSIAIFGGRPYYTNDALGNPVTPVFAAGNRAAITFKAGEAIKSDATGMYITLETTSNGTTSRAERWRVAHGGWLIGKELTANPTTSELAAGDQAAIYVKNDKFVIAYNLSGTINYLVFTLNGSATTFTNSTTAP